MVRSPSGSTARAIDRASELTRSAFEGETASMRQVGWRMYSDIILRILSSMSLGWSPTGTLASPGRSTRVIVLHHTHHSLSRGGSAFLASFSVPILRSCQQRFCRGAMSGNSLADFPIPSNPLPWLQIAICPGTVSCPSEYQPPSEPWTLQLRGCRLELPTTGGFLSSHTC